MISYTSLMDIGLMCQEQVSRAGTSDYIQQMLCGANSFPRPWYLLMVQPSSNPINNTNMTTWRWREAKQSKSYSYFLDTKPRLLTKPTSHLEHGSVIISKLLKVFNYSQTLVTVRINRDCEIGGRILKSIPKVWNIVNQPSLIVLRYIWDYSHTTIMIADMVKCFK